jgi:hypothetical protein
MPRELTTRRGLPRYRRVVRSSSRAAMRSVSAIEVTCQPQTAVNQRTTFGGRRCPGPIGPSKPAKTQPENSVHLHPDRRRRPDCLGGHRGPECRRRSFPNHPDRPGQGCGEASQERCRTSVLMAPTSTGRGSPLSMPLCPCAGTGSARHRHGSNQRALSKQAVPPRNSRTPQTGSLLALLVID